MCKRCCYRGKERVGSRFSSSTGYSSSRFFSSTRYSSSRFFFVDEISFVVILRAHPRRISPVFLSPEETYDRRSIRDRVVSFSSNPVDRTCLSPGHIGPGVAPSSSSSSSSSSISFSPRELGACPCSLRFFFHSSSTKGLLLCKHRISPSETSTIGR